MKPTKLYIFSQNNSGGSFDFDVADGITVEVVIEAHNAEEANTRARDIGLYFNGCDEGLDCPCCGDRWYEVYDDLGDVMETDPRDEEPDLDITWVDEGRNMCVHRLDGTREWY